MLTIRRAQMLTFEQAAQRRFEDRSLAHLRAVAPTHCEAVGEDGLRRLCRLALQRASGHGLGSRGAVRLYLDLMVMFGCDFDTDPQYPWAASVLAGGDGPDPMARAERLHGAAMDYAARVFGRDYEQEKAALRRVAALAPEAWLAPELRACGPWIRQMEKLYPEKVREVGTAALDALFQKAGPASASWGPPPNVGTAIMAGLMFAFGHGVRSDPQFAWVSASGARADADPEAGTRRLLRRAMTYLSLAAATDPDPRG